MLLIILLNREKGEGETVNDFERRVKEDSLKVLGVDKLF